MKPEQQPKEERTCKTCTFEPSRRSKVADRNICIKCDNYENWQPIESVKEQTDMTKEEQLEEAANEYNQHYSNSFGAFGKDTFIYAVKSDTAKEYWQSKQIDLKREKNFIIWFKGLDNPTKYALDPSNIIELYKMERKTHPSP